ncbi:putative nitrogen fixation protein NifT [Chrysiogenes arsenatis]|uniref:putative nitrogen fixation protein NifT n=1 Tax=Chrysiogenes arsenatis TaxID=309797 RepID=UPI0003F8C2BC|nr:putative nitrogen fixation protein NifT [Chrysiogenes arsenatis]
MKVTVSKDANAAGGYRIYVPKKDLEAIVEAFDPLAEGWGGVFHLDNGWKLEIPHHESEPDLPKTMVVGKL